MKNEKLQEAIKAGATTQKELKEFDVDVWAKETNDIIDDLAWLTDPNWIPNITAVFCNKVEA